MMTPQLTEQYGHVLRVSLVREILSVFACAYAGAVSKPNADTAAPAAADFRNVRREMDIYIPTRFNSSFWYPRSTAHASRATPDISSTSGTARPSVPRFTDFT